MVRESLHIITGAIQKKPRPASMHVMFLCNFKQEGSVHGGEYEVELTLDDVSIKATDYSLGGALDKIASAINGDLK